MKYLKMLGLAAVAAMAFMAFAASSASATTLEVGGVTTNESKTITASLTPNTSATLKDTFGFSSNTCKKSHVHGTTTSPYTGATVTGHIEVLTFEECARSVTVHNPGVLHVSHTSGTNGTVTSSGAVVTTGSPFGTLTCETGSGTHLGTLTGTGDTSKHAELDINATLSCSGISSKWIAEYVVTSPTGLGVSA